MGGANAGWSIDEWVPLCDRCHKVLDRQNGANQAAVRDSANIEACVRQRAPVWRYRARNEEE